MKRWVQLWLAGVLGASTASAEGPARRPVLHAAVEQWGVRSGLPAGSVRSIARTSDGYLWVLTSQGPARFDGVRFTSSPELVEALGERMVEIRTMRPGAAGGLWFGGRSFVARLRDGRVTVGDRKDLNVQCLLEARDGTLWIGHDYFGLTRFQDGRFFESDPPTDFIVSALHEDARGVVWMGSWGRGLSADGRARAGGVPSDAYVNEIVADASGTVWVATRAGLHAPNGPAVPRELAKANVTALAPSRDGGLWIGTSDGVVYHRAAGAGGSLETLPAETTNPVLALFEDEEGSLWVGDADGLRRVQPGPFLTYGAPPGLAPHPVLSVLESRDGAIWVFADGGGLLRIDEGTVRRVTTREGLASDYGGPLLEGRDGALWVGTSHGLSRVAGGRVTSYTQGRLSGLISALFEDERGLVVAPAAAGLHRFEGGRLTPYEVDGIEAMGDRYVYQAYRSRNGTVWLATNTGLVRIRGGRVHVFDGSNGLLEGNVRSVHEDAAGTLWIATAKVGIARLQGDRFLVLTSREGLYDDRVYCVLAGDDGHLWMSSPRGLFRVSREDVDDVASGKADRVRSVVYDTADGLPTTDFSLGSQPPGFKSRDGRLWFGTRKGVVAIDTADLGRPLPPPPVVIEGAAVDGREVVSRGTLEVPPGARRVEFHFTGLSLRAPHRLRFRYRLEGADVGWIEDDRRAVSYTNLRPGRYTFQVTASRGDGRWNEQAASLPVQVRPLVHQTALFRWAMVAAAVGLGFLVFRWRLAWVHKRYEAVVEERTRIAREMHDTLAQNLGGLALLLGSIRMQHGGQSPALSAQLEEAARLLRYNLAEAYRAIRDLRAGDLESRDFAGTAAAVLERATSGTAIRGRVQGDGGDVVLAPPVRDGLLRILQEAVANVVRHAEAGEIAVHLSSEGGHFRLTVADDGKGFDAAPAFSLEAGHYGLIGMRERAERLGGRLEIESVAGKGTRVVVEVPAP